MNFEGAYPTTPTMSFNRTGKKFLSPDHLRAKDNMIVHSPSICPSFDASGDAFHSLLYHSVDQVPASIESVDIAAERDRPASSTTTRIVSAAQFPVEGLEGEDDGDEEAAMLFTQMTRYFQRHPTVHNAIANRSLRSWLLLF